jgi:hypothetical protein
MSILVFVVKIKTGTAEPNVLVIRPIPRQGRRRRCGMAEITGSRFTFPNVIDNQCVDFGQFLIQLSEMKYTLFPTANYFTGRTQSFKHPILHPLCFQL